MIRSAACLFRCFTGSLSTNNDSGFLTPTTGSCANDVEVIASSTYETDGVLRFWQDNGYVGEQKVHLVPGKNRYKITHPAEVPAGPKRPVALIAIMIGLLSTIAPPSAAAQVEGLVEVPPDIRRYWMPLRPVTIALVLWLPKRNGSAEGTSTNTIISGTPTSRGTERNRCPRARLRIPIMPSEIAIPPARNPTLVQNPKSKFRAFRISRTKTSVRSGSAFANASAPRRSCGSTCSSGSCAARPAASCSSRGSR